MGIVGGKMLFGLLCLFGLIGGFTVFGISSSLIRWEHDGYACFGGSKFYKAVDPQRYLSLGSLKLYYQPYAWGCDEDHRYDPNKYTAVSGTLEPK